LTWLGWPPLLAKGVGYCAGMVFGFFGNKLWTFRSSGAAKQEPFSYVLVYAFSLLVNITTNQAALYFGQGVLDQSLNGFVAFLVATGLTTVLNFLGLRFIAFRAGVEERRAAEHISP
jgi:putative flippase GtrA